MASRLRIGAALLGATALLSFSALPANADVIATPDQGDQPKGEFVALKEGPRLPSHKERYIETEIIRLQIQGQKDTKVYAYCVELPTELSNGDHLREVEWGKHPNQKQFNDNAGKILWILTNSFPNLPMKKGVGGADIETKWGKQFSEKETIAATQAAIWHFSDGAELDMNDGRNSQDVKDLYTKFLEQAKDEAQPKPTLEIDPAEKAGKSGEKIGPFKVTTTASEVKLTANLPEGVTITDAAGNPLAVQKKGDKELAVQGTGEKVSEFFVNVPAGAKDGEASFQLSAEATLLVGRLFVAKDKDSVGDDKVAQSLIVAQPSSAKVEKEGKANWKLEVKPSEPTTPSSSTPPSSATPSSPTPTTSTTPANPAPGGGEDLASTGASILWPLVGGLVLVAGGVGALFVVRRKKAGA